jgi:GNAT superfamily N-acetyltransferase
MSLPSFNYDYQKSPIGNPRILVLEVREKNDANPERPPIARVMVERVETYIRDPDDVVYEASIALHYVVAARTMPRGLNSGCFYGGYSGGGNRVSLSAPKATRGAIFLDLNGLQGQRIGTYLMNEIVKWAKNWPEAAVHSIGLSSLQATDEENKCRRNAFYEQFGLVFDYDDLEKRSGSSRPMLARDLIVVDRWKENIREITVPEYLGLLIGNDENAKFDLDTKERANNFLRREISLAEKTPLRWAFRILWIEYSGPILLLLCVLGLGVLIWSKM